MTESHQQPHDDSLDLESNAAVRQSLIRYKRLRRSGIVAPPLALLAATLSIRDPKINPDDLLSTTGGSGMSPRKGGW